MGSSLIISERAAARVPVRRVNSKWRDIKTVMREVMFDNQAASTVESGVMVISHARSVERMSGGVAELLGLAESPVSGCGLTEIFPRAEAGSYTHFCLALEQVLDRASPEECGQLLLTRSDGKGLQLDWTLYALNGESAGGSAVLMLKNPAVAMAKPGSLESYRATFEHAVEGIFRTTLYGRYIEVNPALARIYGYASPKELMSELRDLNRQLYVKEGRRGDFVRLIQQQGFVKDFESEVYRSDGTTVWIAEYARTVCDPDGRPLYFEGSVVDITEHQETEAALRESRERFRRLVESINVVPWEADLETGRMIYVGPQAEEFLGYPMKSWLRDKFWSRHIHPEDRAWMSVARAEGLVKRRNFESEYRMVTADGRTVWVRDIVSVIQDENGRELLGGFMLDITKRRAAEESLRESRQFIEQVAGASPVIWYVYDLTLNCMVYLNGGGIGLLGFTKEALAEMQPLFLLALAHPSEEGAWREHLVRLPTLKAGEIVEREFRLRAADGSWVWLRSYESAFKQDAEGPALQIVGTMENITVHQAAVEQLENNEALFRKLVETTRVIPFEVDLVAGRFAYVGPQAETLLGYPLSRWYRPGFWASMLHPDDAGVVERLCREALQFPETDRDAEFRMHTQSGEYKWIRQIVRGESVGEQVRLGRGFLIDVTAAKALEVERESAQRQIRELAVQSQRLMEEERVRVAREIHDELGQALTLFRIDLAWLGGRVGRVVPGEAAAPLMKKLEQMELQLEATMQAARRITTKLRPPVLDEFGLAEAIEWQANDFSRRAGIRCQVTVDFGESTDKDAETVVFRIFQEILTNIARHAKASRVDVRLEQTGAGLKLSVRDNGCGFNPSATKKKAGFGLLGMRERAEGAGGHLEIASAVGGGTTITVALPVSASPRQ